MKNKIYHAVKRWLRFYLYATAIVATLFVLLALTDIPYYAYHNLSLKKQQLTQKADVIVLMGGEGMPSPKGLMRSYFTVKAAHENPNSKIVIALPLNEEDSTEQLDLIANELIKNDINKQRIVFESKGYNTRSQAVEILKMFSKQHSMLIVSSPEHMYRAVRSFEKVGFEEVGSYPTFEVPEDEEMLKSKDKKRRKEEIQSLDLRYNLWSYMQYEIIVFREYLAIAYYWWKGWI